jgi:glycosyltransferase involved in cell wall biosynthesis
MQLANEPGITVTGTVDDVRPYLEKGKIFISPLQFGSGMKNKILNAMAMRKAIIATPLSIEGIDVKNNSHLILADSLEQWTESVKQLIDDRDKRQRLAASGYDLVRNRYSWGNASKTLEEVFKSVVTTSP